MKHVDLGVKKMKETMTNDQKKAPVAYPQIS